MPSQPDFDPPDKPAEVADRDTTWRELATIWQRPAPDLAICLGRRRAGKSWLLSRFARAVGGIYYQATERTEAEQLAIISRIVGEHFEDAALGAGVPFPDWESLLRYVARRAATSPVLLILDEFPYLADAAPALPSIIQAAWDHDWQGTRAKLVLSGSHITAMRQLEGGAQPLYGRRTARLALPPFKPQDVKGFLPGYSARDQLLAYGIVGGLPGHLALLDPARPLADNVMRHVLHPSGRLSDEAQHVLDAFLGEAEVHYSILQAIANGERTWGRITSRVGKSSGSLSRPMRWLEEMLLVTRIVPITEAKPQSAKRTLYRLTDPYIAFWHRFVAPLVATGELGLEGPDLLWRARVLPRLNEHMGGVFEDICRAWVGGTMRLPFRPGRVGAWWDATAQNEIDVVALGGDGDVLVAECKWGTVGDEDLDLLRRRANLVLAELPAGQAVRRVHHALFSGSGEWSDGVAAAIAAGSVLGFGPEDLIAVGAPSTELT